MPTPRNITKTDMTRVFVMEDGAGPTVRPEYMGVWKAGASKKGYGDSTSIEIPSDAKYGEFQEVATVPGKEDKPTIAFTARYTQNLSDMLRLGERRCTHDFQVHMGSCGDLQDFNGGWEKILALEAARVADYTTDDLGALGSDERAAVNETINAQGTDMYEIKSLDLAEICGSSVIQEVLAVTFCDVRTCGECGTTSDGCQKLFALVKSVGGSPGLGAQVVYSDDGGSTCDASPITSLAANEEPDDMSCFGNYLTVVSEDSVSHHYALKDEVLIGTETWAEHTSGYVGGGAPTAIWVLKPGYAWVVGVGGYVYSLDNPANDPVVQDAGSATAQTLADVHAYDEENVMAVGAANAVIHTTDGETWTAVTGPAPAVALNCCWMRSKTEWWVGTAGGKLYYTRNSGVSWTEKQFPGSGAGQVYDIVFAKKNIGYIAHATAAPLGRILRTINGGYDWYVLPEGTGSIPANDRVNALATCGNANMVIGGGLADNAADGFLVKAS